MSVTFPRFVQDEILCKVAFPRNKRERNDCLTTARILLELSYSRLSKRPWVTRTLSQPGW
jgi:hypothetical protein